MKDKTNSSQKDTLRQKAEEILKNKSVLVAKNASDSDIIRLVHELDVHQIELEMQNEELHLAKIKAETEAEKYTNLYDFAPSGYFTLSKKGEIIELNFRGANFLGIERSLLLNKRFGLFVTDETRPTFNLFLEELFDSKTKQTCELALTNASLFVNLSGIISDDEELCLVTMHDVSQRKKAEEETKISEEKYHNLFETNRDSISIFRIDSEGFPSNFIEVNQASTNLFGYTKNELLELNICQVESITDTNIRARIASLLSHGKIDFETIIKTKKGKNRNVEIESILINYLDKPAVMNITRDITERKQNEENTRKAQENLTTILEAIPDLLFEVDVEGRIYYYQGNRNDLLAVPESEFIGKKFKEIIPADAANVCLEAIQEALNKGWSIGKQYSLDLAQGKCWFELSVSPINEPNLKTKHFIMLARDITARKEAQEALLKSQEKLQGIFNVANSGIVMIDKSGHFLLFNDWCCKLLGYTRNELQDLNLTVISHPDDLEKSRILNTKIIEGKINHYQIEKRYKRKDKSYVWCEVSASAIKDQENNVVNIVGIINDITERKKAKMALQKSEARLIETQRLSKLGSWETDFTFKNAIWSRETARIYGIDEKATQFTLEEFLSIVHPEDRLLVQTEFVHSIKKHSLNRFEHRIITPAGIEKFVEQRWKIVRDTQDQPLRAVGSCHDITERKVGENNLKESKRFATATLDALSTHISILDENGYILAVNTAWNNFRQSNSSQNLTLNPIIGENYLQVCESSKGPYSEEALAMAEGIHSVMEGKQDEFSLEYPCHSLTEKRWFNARVTRFAGEGDLRIVVAHENITHRKLAEEKLIASENILNQTQIIAKLGSFTLDFATGKWTSSAVIDSIFGIDDHFERNNDGWQKILHPDWRVNMNNYFHDEVIAKKVNFNRDYKIIKIDSKEERWVHGIGEIIFDNNGQPQQMIGSIQDITDRKLAEESKEEALTLFQNITSRVPGVVYQYLLRQDGTSCFPYASDGIKQIYDIYPAEVLEDATVVFEKIHLEDYDDVVASIQNSAKYLTPWQKEYRVILKDGTIHYLYGNAIPQKLEDGSVLWHGYITDITEKKVVENSLRESEEKYRCLVENSPDGVVIYIEDKIAFINNEGLRMLGAKNKEEIIGKPVLQYVHPESLENIVQKMKEVHQENNVSELIEEKFITLDGTPFDVEIKAIPTLYEHKHAVQVIVHDITQRKQTALELNKINRVYALISQINNLIIRTHNREELFHEICNIAVDFGKFRMSWIGLLNEDNHKIITAAFAGHEKGYFTDSNVTTILNVPEGRGPTGIALREGRTVICNDIANDPMMKPWRKDALKRGYSSVISIPIVVRNKKIGAFNLYSEETNFFTSEEEISLLEKIILNIAFALETIQIEEDRKQTEEKIRQLSQAVEQSPVTIVITNINGEIEYANPKFVETTGYTIEEVVGKNPRFLKSGHTSSNEYNELWQTLSGGKEWHGEFHNKKKDGSFFWESATISPIINAQGESTHFIAIKEDITERKIAEQELINAKLRAEESDRLKLVFLANMSHEIRTPMNGILGFTELLKEPKLSGEEQQEYINIIEKSGKRMLNIINDIISISKIESGLIEVSPSETNINEEIKYIHNFFQPETKQKGIHLYISKELPTKYSTIKTDREKLYAILSNLVKNAIKFTNEGAIEFGCEKKGKNIEFFVKDSGIGISNSQKNVVFERFRQANETISRSHEGAGLGLAISKAYVEMLGGKIRVESEEGKGSTFYFTIPYNFEPELQEKIVIEKTNRDTKEENKINNLKVLIVEDDAISKLLITIAVKPYSKEIIKVSNGIEAIEACRNNPDIDLVMMDINMPEMGGYEATKQIREFNKDLVIIAQTANGMQSDRDEAIASGCTDYISKPINIISLSKLIQEYFNK